MKILMSLGAVAALALTSAPANADPHHGRNHGENHGQRVSAARHERNAARRARYGVGHRFTRTYRFTSYNALPRTYLVPAIETASPGNALAMMRRPSWDPRRTAIVEQRVAGAFPGGDPDGRAAILRTTEVKAPFPYASGSLAFTENHSTRWSYPARSSLNT